VPEPADGREVAPVSNAEEPGKMGHGGGPCDDVSVGVPFNDEVAINAGKAYV
jgi:hypothetical protein